VSEVKKVAQEQAEEAYDIFFKFMKGFAWVCGFIMLALVSCNFGVDGTGSKSDPALYEEYKERMLEMQEEIKKKKYGG
jgi:hypothetical protein|tara:strand:+ start:681 stop:914 length:234 start_codon:yes stop_codon:yes gene_type:complete